MAAFNQGCVRDMLGHVAGAYDVWLGQVALGRRPQPTPPAEIADVEAARVLFARADALVVDFWQQFAERWLTSMPFRFPRNQQQLELTPLQLFTHVTTHEFHHKGQVLSMSRLLGYVPADTDIIRF